MRRRGVKAACMDCGLMRSVECTRAKRAARCRRCSAKFRVAAGTTKHPRCKKCKRPKTTRSCESCGGPAAARKRATDWYSENRERALGNRRKYRKANPEKVAHLNRKRRAAKKSAEGILLASEWEAIQRKQRGRCARCRKKSKLTVDHVVPLAAGGCNLAFNIQGLCRPCNTRKQAQLLSGVDFSLFDRPKLCSA